MTPPSDPEPSLPANLPPSKVGPAKVGPAKVGMVLFTSGSTGRPKGIALHERSALRNVILKYRAACAIGPGDRLLSLHPPSTFGGAGDTFGTLLCGASLHLVDLKREGLARALALLRGAGITVCATVPVVVRALMAIDGATDAFRALRIVRLGGDAVMGSDIAALARLLPPTARIMVGFGMTETGGVVAQRLIDPHAPVEAGRIAMGTPLPDQIVSVLDANGDPTRPNEPGQLLIRGRYVALGHWVAGRIDPAAFPPDPSDPAAPDPATSDPATPIPATQGRRCYRSGDMVLLRPDGMLVPIGRTDRQVKINGLRVEPVDTEAALRSLPDVADAAVLVQGEADTPMLVAFVVPAPKEKNPVEKHAARRNPGDKTPGQQNGHQAPRNAPDQERKWRSALTALLPPQQVPVRIHLVPAIPLLPSLKPDLSALRTLTAAKDAPGMLTRLRARLHRHAAQRATAPVLPPPRRDDTAS
jgi:acyl-coenzyme A synthetase/AMP-(fatty) acid ligase